MRQRAYTPHNLNNSALYITAWSFTDWPRWLKHCATTSYILNL